MVFTNAAGAIATKAHIADHTGWGATNADQQYFPTHNANAADPDGTCVLNSQYEQLAGSGNPRYHVRLKQTFDSSPTYGTTTIATPHLEWACDGGHRIQQSPSGFVEGRTRLYNDMYPAHAHVVTGNWGNNNALYQSCGGYSVRSDGYVTYMSVP